jgi:hypothetical protein
VLVVYQAPESLGPAVVGELLIKRVAEADLKNAKPPLYVIGTSVGPKGHKMPTRKPDKSVFHAYVSPGYAQIALGRDGTIQRVDFRWLPDGAPAPKPIPAPASSFVPAGVAP